MATENLENNKIKQEWIQSKNAFDVTLAIKEKEFKDARTKLKVCQEEDLSETRECFVGDAALMKELEIYKEK